MAFPTVVGESHWSCRCDSITGIPVQISCSTKASVMFPGLRKASHREEMLVPHSSCLCLHGMKETQSRERSFRLCTCGYGLDVAFEPSLTDLWTGCSDPFCLEAPLLVLVLSFSLGQRCVPALPPTHLPLLCLNFWFLLYQIFHVKA